MSVTTYPTTISTDLPTAQRWTGRVLSGVGVLFLTMDGVMKLARPDFVVKGTAQMGWPVSSILPLGIVLLAAVALYIYNRTAFLGALVLTGYLGGAVAAHVRIGDPLFSHILFPTYVAALLWGGLWLRDRRLRALLPISR